MKETIELIAIREGETTRLVAPTVGIFTCALPKGALLGPGQSAGVLFSAGQGLTLLAPAQVSGRVTSKRPERVHHPVGYGTTLYELSPITAGEAQLEAGDAQGQGQGLVLRANQTGRFYRRPSPDEPDYVAPGGQIEVGMAIGLIEIMKTFSQVTYEARDGLPSRAKLVRWLAEDGAEVSEGEPLFEVEPL